MGLKGFRGAKKLLNTIRTHLDTTGPGLTLPNNEITQYSYVWECQCTRNDPQNLSFCPGAPQNTFIFSSIFQNDKSLKKCNLELLESGNFNFGEFETLIFWEI